MFVSDSVTSRVSALVKRAGKRECSADLIARARTTIGTITPADIHAWLDEFSFLYSAATMIDGRVVGGAEVAALEHAFISEGSVLIALLPKTANLRKIPAVKKFLASAANEPAFAVER